MRGVIFCCCSRALPFADEFQPFGLIMATSSPANRPNVIYCPRLLLIPPIHRILPILPILPITLICLTLHSSLFTLPPSPFPLPSAPGQTPASHGCNSGQRGRGGTCCVVKAGNGQVSPCRASQRKFPRRRRRTGRKAAPNPMATKLLMASTLSVSIFTCTAMPA